MAQTEETQEPLKYQTWVLRVSIHCEGCRKKVKKVLQGIDGVYKITTDSQQQKVTVTGNVEAETLIKKLGKTGKHAELWPEPKPANPDSVPNNNNNNGGGSGGKKKIKIKNNNNNNNRNKPNEPSEQPGTKEPESDNGTASAAKTSDTEPTEESPKPDKKDSEAAASAPAEKPSGGGGGKKKGKKGNGGGSGGEALAEESRKVEVATAAAAILSPVPCQDVYHYPMYQVPAKYLVSYNTVQPLAAGSYYVPLAAAAASYDIFSEENANACIVM